MIKKNRKKVNKFFLIMFSIVPITSLGAIFLIYSNKIETRNTTNVLSNDTLSNDTTTIVQKPNLPDISNVFAGSIFHQLLDSGNADIYQEEIFDAFLEIQNPVTNSQIITKKVECVDYSDENGALTIKAKVTPWLSSGSISQTFSPEQTFLISGFKKYSAKTEAVVKSSYPVNLKPSQINDTNINQFVEIINLPNSYEKQPKTSYVFNPDDTKGILNLTVTLTTAVVESPTSGKFFFQDRPVTFNLEISNLLQQASSIIPESNSTIDGSSLNTIAENVTTAQIKDLIFKNSDLLPSNFSSTSNIFDVTIFDANNDSRSLVFNAKIFNYYDDRGILVNDKDIAKQLTNITVSNLKEAIETSVEVKKEGTTDLLAQTIWEKSDNDIINDYIQIVNPPPSNSGFNVQIKNKSFDNILGTLSLSVAIKNYYHLGSIVSDEKIINLNIVGFKKVFESNSVPNSSYNSNILPSEIDFNNPDSDDYISNFIKNTNYPGGTTFTYEKVDVDNSKGFLKLNVVPSKWYDQDGVLNIKDSTNTKKIAIILDNLKIRKPTSVVVNESETTPDKIGNIYASDINTQAKAEKYIKFISAPSDISYTINNFKAQNSAQLLSFDVLVNTYYNDKGLLVTNASSPKIFPITIKGFKYRGKSFFSQLPDASNFLPSDINESNWFSIIDRNNFPDGTTFNNLTFKPTNKDGILIFSATPSQFYDINGEIVNNTNDEIFSITVTNMKQMQETYVSAVQRNGINNDLFNLYPEQINDQIIKENKNPKEILSQYVEFNNKFSDSTNDYDIIYDPSTGFNNIGGTISFKVLLKNYYDEKGNPVTNKPKSPITIEVKGFYRILSNWLILPNVDSSTPLSSVDPYSLVSNPNEIIKYISFIQQENNSIIDKYKGPKIEIISVTGGNSGNGLLDRGSVFVNYKLSNYFDTDGIFQTEPAEFSCQLDGFKSRINASSGFDFVWLIILIVIIVVIVMILIICLGILFRKKKYYINENYDRGTINAEETTIPTVIKTRDKIKNSFPRLIPLVKQIKPPKPLKQYKPIKKKEVKVKPPKQPILPGQRKREFLEMINIKNQEFKNKVKSIFSDKYPINEPFEIDGNWYYKNEEGKFFISSGDNQWIETSRPKKTRKNKNKEKKDNNG